METVWVLGDQLDRDSVVLRDARPAETVVLLVESEALLRSRRWHPQRAHLVLAAMRRFAAQLRAEGFAVDERRAPTLAAGVREHRAEWAPDAVRIAEPLSRGGLALARQLGCRVERDDRFLCHYEEFAAWAAGRRTTRLEDFYRWQRRRLGYLMDGDEPVGGRWNYDAENRLPPPRDARRWPRPPVRELDALDAAVLRDLAAVGIDASSGELPSGLWPTTRADALRLLDHVVADVLPSFGPYEDAMLAAEWRLNHSLLASSLNLGLLRPQEVCDRVETATRAGALPIASAEGFVRQVLGWREFVWGLYWLHDDWLDVNALEATRPLPGSFAGAPTRMRCVSVTLDDVARRGYAHHIQRLMILGDLCLLAGIRPAALVDWMSASFVDAAEWVMLPNVVGMALYADGGRMATKPYAAGGRYVDRMSDYCSACVFDPRRRTGAEACPLTTLYWDFLDRNGELLATNRRMGHQVAAARRLPDLADVRRRAQEVLALLDAGAL